MNCMEEKRTQETDSQKTKSDVPNQSGNEDKPGKDDRQNLAVNPNPRANSNVQDKISGLSDAEKRETENRAGGEITDGEDG